MKNLRTARVLIVDDVPEEAVPIIQALGSLGVGCAYVSGDRMEDLPTEPFSGIRVAFVDMKLGIEGSSKEVVGKTVNVLRTVLPEEAAPIIFVAWTKHVGYVEEFKETLSAVMPKLGPLVIHRMEKPQLGNGKISFARVVSKLNKLLKEWQPLGALWCWEQMAHEATTKTTKALAQVASYRLTEKGPNEDEAGAWYRALSEILRLLIAAGAGRNDDDVSTYQGLLEVLNSIHFDRLQNESFRSLNKELKYLSDVALPKISKLERATLSSLLFLSPVEVGDLSVRPGNVYLPKRTLGLQCPHGRCKIDVEGLTKDLLNLQSDQSYKKLTDELKSAMAQSKPPAEIHQKKAAMRSRANELIAKCKLVLLEVSPSCDYSQQTRHVSRFVAGFLVPDELEGLFKNKKKESTKKFDPINLEALSGIWHLLLSSRFPYSIPKPETSIKSLPICRLRSPLVVDIQAWLSAQSARPGFLNLPED